MKFQKSLGTLASVAVIAASLSACSTAGKITDKVTGAAGTVASGAKNAAGSVADGAKKCRRRSNRRSVQCG